MEHGAAELSAAIGARIRSERQARGWTLDKLADVAAVSRRMVVSIEQGTVNPSVGTLLRLSDALGVGLPALVASPQPELLKVTPAGEGASLWSGPAGGRGVLVAGTAPPDVVELWDWSLGPGDRHAAEAHAPGTRELIHVHEGSLSVEVGEQTALLEAGDAIAFLGDVDHAYANPTDGPTRFSLAVFEPGVGGAASVRGRGRHG